MSIRAAHIEPWQLVANDVQDLIERVVEHDVENKTVRGWEEEAEHSVLMIRRKLIGFLAHDPDTGEEKGSFVYETFGGRKTVFSRLGPASEKYRCTSDTVHVVDHITGEAFQTQRWELITKLVPIGGSYYERTATAPDP